MPQALFYVTSIGVLGASAAFAMAGTVVERRWGHTPQSVPRAGLVLWWYGLAAATLLAGTQNVLVMYGITSLAVHMVTFQLFILGTAFAVSGLMVHLLYLYTGHESVLALIVTLVLAGLVVLLMTVVAGHPEALILDGGHITVLFASARAEDTAASFLTTMSAIQVLGSLAYAGAFRYVRDTSQRYRVAMLALGIGLWGLGGLLTAGGTATGSVRWGAVASVVLPMGPLVVLLAYEPPARLRRRYGLRSATEATA